MTKPARNRGSKTASARSAAKAERIGELTDQLASGISALASTEEWQAYLDFQARFPHYSFGNVMLILLQCPEATMVMPYGKPEKPGTWMNIGRHAAAGQKALYIRKPTFRKIDPEDSPDGRERTEMRFIWVPVFDVSQTEGDPVPEDGVHLLDGDDPDGILALVVKFIESKGFTVEFVPNIPGSQANGDCDYSGRIRVCTDGRSPLQQAKTATHEAAHMLLHNGSLLPRELKELEAESVAYVVGQCVGLQTSDYSFGYVLGWSGGADQARNAIKASGARIHDAAKAILAGIGAIELREHADEPAAAPGSVTDIESVAA
jgi:hypothetical protein